MKYRQFLLYIVLVTAFFVAACTDHSEPPLSIESSKADGITLNKSALRPMGIDTLFINQGDTVSVIISSVLPSSPDYTYSSGNEQAVRVIAGTGKYLMNVIAVGDSGTVTQLSIYDAANEVEKNVPVKVTRYWADPLFYNDMGRFNTSNYYQSLSKLTWTEARELCEEAGGHLVTISSEEENEFINERRSSKADDVWIGVTLLYGNENFRYWITGEPIDFRRSVSTSAGIFHEVYYYMNSAGLWDNWHEDLKYWVLELE
ncbi:C-type lectin domain-containing protein [bacterium]|nr:C-type lectin domain-containing protein [bacterium]